MRLRTWAPVVFTAVVALLAFFAISGFRIQADEARQAQILFRQLEVEAGREGILEWRALAAREVDSELLRELASIRARIGDVTRNLLAVAGGDNKVSVVAEQIRSYEAALDIQFELVAQGRFG